MPKPTSTEILMSMPGISGGFVRVQVTQEKYGVFVAQCQDDDIASDGATEEEAVAALKEALVLYFESTPNARSSLDVLRGSLLRFDNPTDPVDP